MINDSLCSRLRNVLRRRSSSRATRGSVPLILNTLLLACAATLPLPVLARETATVSPAGVRQDAVRPFTPNEADNEQLNVPNGCFLEAIRFKALHPGNDSGIIVVDVGGMEHAIVAYPKNGKLWSHCAMLGDVPLGLKASNLTNVKRVQRAYFNCFCEKLNRVERKGERWPVKDSRPGDTPAICVARASQVMDSLRIKNAVVAYTKPDGERSYALITAIAKGIAIYAPEVGSIQPGVQEFGPEMANTFAEKYLGFAPVSVGYEKPANILGEHGPALASGSNSLESGERMRIMAGRRTR